MNYEQKYLKYKSKYNQLKCQLKGGAPKFPNADASGMRVIIDRSRVAKIESSKLVGGTYMYKITYVDKDPRVEEDNVNENRIISFPRNIRTINPDKYYIIEPKRKIFFTIGGIKKSGQIVRIIEDENETYDIFDPHNFFLIAGKPVYIQIPREYITFD